MLADLVKRTQPLSADSKLLVLGGGYSGRCLANLARALGTPVLCTRRSLDSAEADLLFDSNGQDQLDPAALDGVTHLLSTIPPDREGNDPVLLKLLPTLGNLPLRWAGYLSTTGVYGDRQGGWVAEQDDPAPALDRSMRRLNCEKTWLRSGLPIQILRLPGIYGPGRSVLNGLEQGRARLIDKPGQVFCRIHVEDIAGACWHLMHRAEQGVPASPGNESIVNVVDDLPSSHRRTDAACRRPIGLCSATARTVRPDRGEHESDGSVVLEREPPRQQPQALPRPRLCIAAPELPRRAAGLPEPGQTQFA